MLGTTTRATTASRRDTRRDMPGTARPDWSSLPQSHSRELTRDDNWCHCPISSEIRHAELQCVASLSVTRAVLTSHSAGGLAMTDSTLRSYRSRHSETAPRRYTHTHTHRTTRDTPAGWRRAPSSLPQLFFKYYTDIIYTNSTWCCHSIWNQSFYESCSLYSNKKHSASMIMYMIWSDGLHYITEHWNTTNDLKTIMKYFYTDNIINIISIRYLWSPVCISWK